MPTFEFRDAQGAALGSFLAPDQATADTLASRRPGAASAAQIGDDADLQARAALFGQAVPTRFLLEALTLFPAPAPHAHELARLDARAAANPYTRPALALRTLGETVTRNSPAVAAIAAALRLSPSAVNRRFRAARALARGRSRADIIALMGL